MSLAWKTGLVTLIACVALIGCGGDDSDESTSGAGGSGGASGTSSGEGGTSGGGSGGTSGGGSGGTSGTGSGGTGGAGGGLPEFTCTEDLPTMPVTCGGTECPMPEMMGGMDTCQRPCCVADECGIKSANSLLPSECAVPGVPDPSCPNVDFMSMPLVGCCTGGKCGIISELRGGVCITESPIVDLPAMPQACGEGGSEDAGTP